MKRRTTSPQEKNLDIIKLILKDHQYLKNLIRVLVSDNADFRKKSKTFSEFAPLLIAHAKPEEQSLYVHLKETKTLREHGFEGDVEHHIVDQLLNSILGTRDQDEWQAKVKVLAELLQHHIDEEENDLLPLCREELTLHERIEVGREFLQIKQRLANRNAAGKRARRQALEAQTI